LSTAETKVRFTVLPIKIWSHTKWTQHSRTKVCSQREKSPEIDAESILVYSFLYPCRFANESDARRFFNIKTKSRASVNNSTKHRSPKLWHTDRASGRTREEERKLHLLLPRLLKLWRLVANWLVSSATEEFLSSASSALFFLF